MAAVTIALLAAAPATASAQDGAAAGLSAPGEQPPTPSQPAPSQQAPTHQRPTPQTPSYVPLPPAYGGQPLDVQGRHDGRRSDVDRTPKHVGNLVTVIGAAVFANAYLSMALAGLMTGLDWLVVPVIGPFVMIAEEPSSFDHPVFWVDGILQLVGAAALAVGLGVRFSFDPDPGPEASEAWLAPWVGPGAGGLGVTATF